MPTRIIVLEKGMIKEMGSHEELMELEDGLYRSLVRLQMARPSSRRRIIDTEPRSHGAEGPLSGLGALRRLTSEA